MTTRELVEAFRTGNSKVATEAFEAISAAMAAASDPQHPIHDRDWRDCTREELLVLGLFLLDAAFKLNIGLDAANEAKRMQSAIDTLTADLAEARRTMQAQRDEISNLKASKRRLRDALDRRGNTPGNTSDDPSRNEG